MALSLETIISNSTELGIDPKSTTGKLGISLIARILKLKTLNGILDKLDGYQGLEMINELFDELNFSYLVSEKDKRRIPAEGKLIMVANHPLGAMDGLALLKLVSEVRQDVKILANDVLLEIEPLKKLFIPINIFRNHQQRDSFQQIQRHIENDGCLIIFPAGEVSRLSGFKIRDKNWRTTAIKLSHKFQCPVQPAFIKARNSLPFYVLSALIKPLSSLLLPREMLKMANKDIVIKIGDPIPHTSLRDRALSLPYLTKLLREHTYKLRKTRRLIYRTEKTIIHPVPKQELNHAIRSIEMIGQTRDHFEIYQFTTKDDASDVLLKELSRLRELTFRAVGEGTGSKADRDRYDDVCTHLILWDSTNLEIVGGYRFGFGQSIIQQRGSQGFYNASEFNFAPDSEVHFCQSIELGRSFIQKSYWGTNALDYLWQGIGACVQKHSGYRFLFGAVSISDAYPNELKSLIIHFLEKWYSPKSSPLKAKHPFKHEYKHLSHAEEILKGQSPEEDYRTVKQICKNYSLSFPVLIKKYIDVCDYGGVQYLDFGVDKNFSNSVDCLVMVDMQRMKHRYYLRYFKPHQLAEVS